MARPVPEVLPVNVLDHPAVKAWNQLQLPGGEPEGIEIVKQKNKSIVYRLPGLAPDGSAVIAKKCRARTAWIERLIYQEILSQLPVPALRCYGCVGDPKAEVAWLFLEEASDQEYSERDTEHRAAAGPWVGIVHAASRKADWASRLPGRKTDYYLARLRSSREVARQHLANPNLTADEVSVLAATVLHCDVLEWHWNDVETICERIPPALVHGDLVCKNVRVRTTPGGTALLAFDWEHAGWGVPVTDLAQFTGRVVSPDLTAYAAAVSGTAESPDLRDLQRLAACGEFFRLLDEIYWDSLNLGIYSSYEYLCYPLSCLKGYATRMAKALQAAGWLE